MSGFQYAQSFRLEFEDPSMAGFECVMREPDVYEMLSVTELLFEGVIGGAKATARDKLQRRTQLMASHITEWNLVDKEGAAFPICADSILKQGKGFSVQLTAAWLREVVGLTIPPAQNNEPSSDGTDSALAGLPMEAPSDGEPESLN